MANPHWTSYVGMFTGIIGTVTGIFGAIMGFKSYRRSNSFKSLDLRLELRKSVKDLHQMYPQLNMLMINANKSRSAIAAAKGYFHSGKMEQCVLNLYFWKIVKSFYPVRGELVEP